MSKSEELIKQSQKEDSDLKALGLMTKAIREKRQERFEDILEPLNQKYDIIPRQNGSYSIFTDKYGVLDYFPKANNLLMRKNSKWFKPGLKWIINNLL